MKKIQLILSLLLGISLAGFSQVVKKGAEEVATIKTPTVQCEECKERIE